MINLNNKTDYIVDENKNLVKNKLQIDENINSNTFQVTDARGKKRFEGVEPEPRSGLTSGHIKHSKNIPFTETAYAKNIIRLRLKKNC